MTATIQPTETRKIVIEAASYEEARALANDQTPEGWRVLSLITER